MAVADRDLIRAINRFNILNTIRNAGLISRVEISEMTGQSRATVTNITAELVRKNLIFEKELRNSKTRGRKRILLTLNPDAAYVVGTKISDLQISFVVTNMMADILSSLIIPVRTSERPVEFIADLIEEGIRHCVNDARLNLEMISGIGIGVPGFVDSASGICYWSALYKKGDVPLQKLVYDRLSIPTFIENDANAVTLAEQWFGEGKGINNFLVVTVEHGIGMGIVVNGQLYRGAQGIAAEFGHMVVRPGGNTCRCGKRGCIEAYASDISIMQAAKDSFEKGEWIHDDLSKLSIDELTILAKKKELALKKIFEEAGSVLGLGIAGLIQMFNPSKIIVCGEGVRASDLLFEPMRKAIYEHTNKEMTERLDIVIQKWKDTDWARGAASLVLQELFKSPFNRVRPVI